MSVKEEDGGGARRDLGEEAAFRIKQISTRSPKYIFSLQYIDPSYLSQRQSNTRHISGYKIGVLILREECITRGHFTQSHADPPSPVWSKTVLWFRFRGVHTSNNCCPPTGLQVEHQTKSSSTFQRGFHCPLPRLPEKSNPSPNI